MAAGAVGARASIAVDKAPLDPRVERPRQRRVARRQRVRTRAVVVRAGRLVLQRCHRLPARLLALAERWQQSGSGAQHDHDREVPRRDRSTASPARSRHCPAVRLFHLHNNRHELTFVVHRRPTVPPADRRLTQPRTQRSASIIVVVLVGTDGNAGMIDASMTHRFSKPCTRPRLADDGLSRDAAPCGRCRLRARTTSAWRGGRPRAGVVLHRGAGEELVAEERRQRRRSRSRFRTARTPRDHALDVGRLVEEVQADARRRVGIARREPHLADRLRAHHADTEEQSGPGTTVNIAISTSMFSCVDAPCGRDGEHRLHRRVERADRVGVSFDGNDDHRMVAQVLADRRQIGDGRDAQCRQLVGGADTRAQRMAGTAVRACGEHDLVAPRSAHRRRGAHRTPESVDDSTRSTSTSDRNVKFGRCTDRVEIRQRRALPDTVDVG